MKQVLNHTSQDTAYLVEDYPYGFTLRCQMRCWLETRKNHGTRYVTQTSNPKTGKWNKPKASTYHPGLVIMFLDDQNHIGYDVFRLWDIETADKFLSQYGDILTDDQKQYINSFKSYYLKNN